jgi:hypothetical protein
VQAACRRRLLAVWSRCLMAAGAPACSSTFIDLLEDFSSVDDGRFSIEFQPIESRSHRGLKDLRKVRLRWGAAGRRANEHQAAIARRLGIHRELIVEQLPAGGWREAKAKVWPAALLAVPAGAEQRSRR